MTDNCKNCSKEFKVKREWHKFCSTKCRQGYWKNLYAGRKDTEERLDAIEKKLGLNKKTPGGQGS